ncbi:hypothetical protein TorRG33x02_049060 [Trema orientale]|uniref:Transmembrane protein n=1 Tax=Trema orientale TaxID=63057 RepID=A0A2P5FNQ2_TREOI|nr:hypothetical protein TorRG33x02_049060 [Trema orientale]
MPEMKRFVCFSLLALLLLFLSQSRLTSAQDQGVLGTNPHHHVTQISPKAKDFLTCFEAPKLRNYVRRRRGGGGRRRGGIATRARGRTSSAIGKRQAFLMVFLCFTLFLGVVSF